MVRIGIVGLGFMGRIHYLASKKLRDASICSIQTRDMAKQKGDWTNTRGNFGPEPGRVDLSDIKVYSDYSDLIADPNIDLIDICNPTEQHAEYAIRALNAGKHVLVEKAIALTIREADEMLAAAKRNDRQLMVAHVLPFFPEFRYVYDCVRTEQFGKLCAGHMNRIISKPDWSTAISDSKKTGGPAIDLHIHDTHFIGLIAGVPNEVMSMGITENDSVNYLTTLYGYDAPDSPRLSVTSGAIAMPGRPFAHGFEFYFDNATIVYHSDRGKLNVIHRNGQNESPTLPGSDDPLECFTAELQEAVTALQTHQPSHLLSAELAKMALKLCLKECESVASGRKIKIEL